MERAAQNKALELFFGFFLGAKVGEKFELTESSLTTISKNDVERVVPIETIPTVRDWFIFSKDTFNTEAQIAIVRTKKNVFIFCPSKMKEYIKDNKEFVEKHHGYWTMEYKHIPQGIFYVLEGIFGEGYEKAI